MQKLAAPPCVVLNSAKARNGLGRGSAHPFELNTGKPMLGADVN